MIRLLTEKPDAFANITAEMDWYWVGYDENGPYGYLAAKREHEVHASVHSELLPERFNRGVLRSIQADWAAIRAVLKAAGLTLAVAVTSPDNAVTIKLWKYMGFPVPLTITVAQMEL